MRIAVASDHAGVDHKDAVVQALRRAGHAAEDFGPMTAASVDYPDFAERVARAVAEGRVERGILVCGTGIGMSISANKVSGVRAALAHDAFTAEMSRRHNDANVLCLGARILPVGPMLAIVDLWMTTPFDGGRHANRVDKINKLDAC